MEESRAIPATIQRLRGSNVVKTDSLITCIKCGADLPARSFQRAEKTWCAATPAHQRSTSPLFCARQAPDCLPAPQHGVRQADVRITVDSGHPYPSTAAPAFLCARELGPPGRLLLRLRLCAPPNAQTTEHQAKQQAHQRREDRSRRTGARGRIASAANPCPLRQRVVFDADANARVEGPAARHAATSHALATWN